MGRARACAPPPALSLAIVAVLALSFASTSVDATVQSGAVEAAEGEAPHTEAMSSLSASSEDVVEELRAARATVDALFSWSPLLSAVEPLDAVDALLRESLGVNLGAAYTSLYLGPTRDPRPSGGGKFDLFGIWVLLDGGNDSLGFLGFELSAWQSYTPVSPGDLGASLGSQWPVANDFSRLSLSLAQLYWEQQIPGGKLAYRIGKIAPEDVFDVYRFKGSDFYFLNSAFTSNPAIGFPGKGLGVIAAVDLGLGAYLLGGASDAQGRDNTSGFSTLFDDGEIFSTGELGWDGDTPGLGAAQVHTTVWNSPAYEGQGAGWGIANTIEQEIGANVVPFARYAYGAGTATGLRHLATLGIGVDGLPERDDDVAAVAFAWGAPTDPDARNQISGEIFYRLQLTPLLQLTPGYQMILHPVTDPTRDLVGIFEVRLRLTI